MSCDEKTNSYSAYTIARLIQGENHGNQSKASSPTDQITKPYDRVSIFWIFSLGHTTLYLAISVCRSVRCISESQAVFALRPLPIRPRLSCRVSGLISVELEIMYHVSCHIPGRIFPKKGEWRKYWAESYQWSNTCIGQTPSNALDWGSERAKNP